MHLEDQPARVLCVDDDQAVRDLLRVQLAKNGYDVVTAADGENALKLLASEHPDVLLVDASMARVDELALQIKETPESRDIPIIALSDAGQAGPRARLFDAGIACAVVKPVDIAELTAVMRSHIRALLARRTLLETNQELQSAYDSACESEARYRSLVNESLDAIFVVDPETGAVAECNPAAASLLGVSRAQVAGRLFGDYCPDAPSQPGTVSETWLVCDGVKIPVMVKLAAIRAISARLLQYAVRDMRPLYDSLESRLEAERVAAIQEVGVTLSDRINTPLSVIINSAEALRKSQRGAESKVFTRLDYILKAAKQIRDVVQMLTRVQRASSKEYLPGTQMLDLDRAIAEAEKGQSIS